MRLHPLHTWINSPEERYLPMNDLIFKTPRILFLMFISLLPWSLQGQEPAYFLPDTLPLADSMSFEQLNAVSIQMLRQAEVLHQFHLDKTTPLQQKREALEAELALAREDSTITKDSLKLMQKSLKIAKSREKEALRAQQKAAQALTHASELSAITDTTAMRVQVPKVFREIQKLASLSRSEDKKERPVAEVIGPVSISDEPAPETQPEPPAPPENIPDTTETEVKAEKGKRGAGSEPAKKIRTYDPSSDVMLHPPTPPCALAVERRDVFSGEWYRETAPEELFRFTNAVMKKILEGKPHILCDASMSKAGNNLTLRLRFTIQDANARRTFNGLAQGSMAVLKFMDGSTQTLYNNRSDNGTQNPETGAYTFVGQYEIDAATQKKIATQELDKLRIAWMTGYEDYDIYLVEVLMQQLKCLSNPKP